MSGLATGFSGGKPDAGRCRQIAGQGIAAGAEPPPDRQFGRTSCTSPTIVKAAICFGSCCTRRELRRSAANARSPTGLPTTACHGGWLTQSRH